jgi:poly(3-hydroxybutyrate) depolymerase
MTGAAAAPLRHPDDSGDCRQGKVSEGWTCMLYQLYEWQQASLLPMRLWASATMAFHSHPLNPWSYSPTSRAIAAGADLLLRTTHRYEKPEFGLSATTVDDEPVAVWEESVLEKPFCTLLHFRRDSQVRHPKVLVVSPLAGHHATLLRDTVKSLIQHHDVYITDWRDARGVPLSQGPFHFRDYVAYVVDFIRFLGPELHVISVCQPTVPVLAAIALMAADGERTPLTMTMMGGPIDTRKNPTAVNTLATDKDIAWFEDNVVQRVPAEYPGYKRKVCPGFLQLTGFILLNAQRHWASHEDYFHDLVRGDGVRAGKHRTFYDEYNAVMDMPAEYYLDTIRMVFQEHQLPRGTMQVSGNAVRPSAITRTALFTIEGELDDISGSGQTRAAHDLCTGIPASRRRHLTAEGAGHYGIFSGRRYREIVYPEIRDFIAMHATK